jgi:hypothetical protein
MFFKTQRANPQFPSPSGAKCPGPEADEESCSILGDPEPFHNALLGSAGYRYGNLGELLVVTNLLTTPRALTL